MVVKATLKIVLQADDTVVAESDDSSLWQKVLVAINSGNSEGIKGSDKAEENSLLQGAHGTNPSNGDSLGKNKDAVSAFAEKIGVDVDLLEGACRPRSNPPYISLDYHHYEAFKKVMPARGHGSVANIVLAATALVLWSRHAGFGNISTKDTSVTLKTINATQKNPTRSLKDCKWLQINGDHIVINPSKISKAYAVIKTYCLGERQIEE